MWYAIQVMSGREEIVRERIRRAVSRDCYNECLILYYEGFRRYSGEWHKVKKVLLPGYLLLETDTIDTLRTELYKIQELTKLLG